MPASGTWASTPSGGLVPSGGLDEVPRGLASAWCVGFMSGGRAWFMESRGQARLPCFGHALGMSSPVHASEGNACLRR